eukprot:NODE_6255_length_1688_cov_2.867393.p2 GENE.NODE_6255_length_1688_cov_2.867393~~NODE_6255_length_1688_cov_2.867393.p2  ORF type:complete len:317 (-),score=84.41 NODE_6255_length_1688_cov_2.867393:572-1522(-)
MQALGRLVFDHEVLKGFCCSDRSAQRGACVDEERASRPEPSPVSTCGGAEEPVGASAGAPPGMPLDTPGPSARDPEEESVAPLPPPPPPLDEAPPEPLPSPLLSPSLSPSLAPALSPPTGTFGDSPRNGTAAAAAVLQITATPQLAEPADTNEVAPEVLPQATPRRRLSSMCTPRPLTVCPVIEMRYKAAMRPQVDGWSSKLLRPRMNKGKLNNDKSAERVKEYRKTMAERFDALGMEYEKQKLTRGDLADPSTLVLSTVRAYHEQSEKSGRFFPLPAVQSASADDGDVVDMKQRSALRAYSNLLRGNAVDAEEDD